MDPILIVPWEKDFIAGLRDILLRDLEQGDIASLADCLLVFPHHRPARYLTDSLAEEPRLPKPCLLPRCQAAAELISSLRAASGQETAPLKRIDLLDQVWLLHEIVSGLGGSGSPLACLPRDMGRFFPWGVRLAGLLEELFRHGREAENLQYVEDEVVPWAGALLSRLGEICRAYQDGLAERHWTTAGLDCLWAAHNPDLALSAIPPGRPGGIILAGFYGLSGTEDILFRRLTEQGRARVVWHSDPALADGRAGHFAVAEHRAWLKRWGAGIALADLPAGGHSFLGRPGRPARPARKDQHALFSDNAAGPSIRFHEAYDLHSQLKGLAEELEELGEAGGLSSTAVVVPDTAMLMPVLHTLPVKDVNVSMGFPLARTSLHRLIESILALQERSADGLYYWRDLVDLVRHPYLRMLAVQVGEEPGRSGGDTPTLRNVLHTLEAQLRRGVKYALPPAWIPPDEADASFLSPEAVETALDEVFAVCLTGFSNLSTLAGLAGALRGLCSLLLRRGGNLWSRFPLDGECLHRLLTEIVPAVEGSMLSREPLPRATQFAILRRFFAGERVAFEAEPLTGLQVLGVLEARLLRFRNLLILGATEDKLPGTEPYDPLLPDPLRHLLGLPDSRQRDIVAAYTFYSLVRSAETVRIFYSSGSHGSALFEDKAVRSRFVEQLLFEHEQRSRVLLKPGVEPLRAVSFRMRPLRPRSLPLAKTPAIRDRLAARLGRKGLSPSTLDSYLRCPARYYYEQLTPIRPPEEVSEDGDVSALGTLIHDVLKEFFTDWLGRTVNPSVLDPLPLEELFSRQLRSSPFYLQTGYATRIVLERTGRERLRRYLRSAPATRIVGLEEKGLAEFRMDGTLVLLSGRIDRIDERNGELVVLDYKTGSFSTPDEGSWLDAPLWERLQTWRGDSDGDPVPELRDRFGSLQLPLYLAMLRAAPGSGRTVPPTNAAYVELRGDGREAWLFSDEIAPQERDGILDDKVPALVSFILRHMRDAAMFSPQASGACDYCPYPSVCGRE